MSPKPVRGMTAVCLALALTLDLFPGTSALAQMAAVRPVPGTVVPGSANAGIGAGMGAGLSRTSAGTAAIGPSVDLSLSAIAATIPLSPGGVVRTGASRGLAVPSISRYAIGANVGVVTPLSATPETGSIRVPGKTDMGTRPLSLSRAAKTAPAPKTVAGRLSSAVSRIPGLLKLSGSGLKAGSGRAFDGSARVSGSEVSPVSAVLGRSRATLSGPRLTTAASLVAGKEEAAGKSVAEVSGREGKAPAPKQKISRAIRIGALTAILMLAVDMVVMAAATYMGYQFHPSYEMPALSDPAAFSALGDFLAPIAAKVQEFFTAAWVAPFNEEVYFRAGVIGLAGIGALRMVRGVVRVLEKIRPKFSKLRSWIVPVGFGMAAAEAAMFFALLHEMSDPVLIAIRLVQSLLFSYLYVREGLISGMAHHAVFNGLAILTLPLVYGTGVAGTIILAPQALIAAAVLGVALYALWRFTRPAAKREGAEMRAGRLAPYRLSAKASRWLGRAGWATVAILLGLAALQPTSMGVVLLGSMAAQVAPAALALQAYGFLLRNLERRKGAEAVAEIRNPKSPLPMGNRVGAWVGGVFGAMFLGFVGGTYLFLGVMKVLPGLGLLSSTMVAAAVAMLPVLGIAVYRLWAGKRGISPWAYVAQFLFGSAGVSAAALPWIAPALERLVESAAQGGLGAGAIMPALSSQLWTIPVFVLLAVVMSLIGRAIVKRRATPPIRAPDRPASPAPSA